MIDVACGYRPTLNVEELYRQLLKHQEAETMMKSPGGPGYQSAVQAKYKSFRKIANFYKTFPELLAPYVRMDTKMP